MNATFNSLIDNTVQCWGCPIFDRLIQVISSAAAAVYGKFAILCTMIFFILFAFFVLNAVWKNMRSDGDDPFFQKSVRPVFINSLVALALLSMGVWLPRFVTTVTFEPVADITATYTQTMLQLDEDEVNTRVTYQPMTMADDGFYRPELRDKIIFIMKITISQFQSYMKLGLAVIDSAFTWSALLDGVGALVKHIIILIIGIYLVYGFVKLFVRFCFYFADVIIAMTFFAFFFPLSLTLVVFKGADGPKWMASLGKNVGTDQFKKVINAIIGLAAAVLTYTVIMVIIAKFFSPSGTSVTDLMTLIANNSVFEDDLDQDNLAQITLGSAIVLVYVLNFIYEQIPKATKMVLDAFDVDSENQLGEQLANDALRLTSASANYAKKIGKIIINGGDKTEKK